MDAFSNSIFAPYRASALFQPEIWHSKGTNFSLLSTICENLKKISWGVSEKISEQNDTLKIRNSSISRTGSDVIIRKITFSLSRQIYTIPENFMKIRPGVLEKSSNKKKLDTISLRATSRSSVRLVPKIPNYVIYDLIFVLAWKNV